jgi:uncharacterized membrane protein YoaK (UPF0700 family)
MLRLHKRDRTVHVSGGEAGKGKAQARARALLGALAFAAGCTDAITYVALGHVFTANMTGNTVLLGIAVIAGSTTRIARSACAVAGFCLGVALAARFIGQRGQRLWPGRVTAVLLGEAAALAALAATAAALGTAGAHIYWLIALSGMAMGAQSAAVQAVAVPAVATTYITGTITSLIAGSVVRHGWSEPGAEQHSRLRLAAAIWIAYIAAVLAGAAATRAIDAQAVWIATSVVLAVAGAAFRYRRELAAPV